MSTIKNLLALFKDEIEKKVLVGMTKVTPTKIGIDDRCGPLWIGEEGIIVRTNDDPRLRYYGGFEYVNKEHCIVIDEYVFYSIESNLVKYCYEHLNNTESSNPDQDLDEE